MKEIWKDLPNFEELYEISNLGNVRRKERTLKAFNRYRICSKKLKGQDLKKRELRGYYSVGLWKDGKMHNKTIHRLVAKAFIPNPNNLPVVNHIDGNKKNNRVDNLEWCTYSHNAKEAYRLNLINMSQKHIETARQLGINSRKKIVQKDLEGNVIKVFSSGLQASRITGISQGNISQCCSKKRKSIGGYLWEYTKEVI